ncbi:hypothetical protein F5141DRAFT_1220394 [Pisolithus sp. B1]|nr:hypothetical protein F5141DRAFT_1220394 [Pisolithus sp. B1]
MPNIQLRNAPIVRNWPSGEDTVGSLQAHQTVIMPWSTETTRTFAAINKVANRSFDDWQNDGGPYKKLLHTLSPVYSDFLVSHDFLPVDIGGGADAILSFEVTLRQHPVFVPQIQPPTALVVYIGLCGIIANFALVVLLLITFRAYASACPPRDQRDWDQAPLRDDPELTIDVAPQNRWDCDVLEADGERRLQALVPQITEE